MIRTWCVIKIFYRKSFEHFKVVKKLNKIDTNSHQTLKKFKFAWFKASIYGFCWYSLIMFLNFRTLDFKNFRTLEL